MTTSINKISNNNNELRGERGYRNRFQRGKKFYVGESSGLKVNTGNRLKNNDLVKNNIQLFRGTLGVDDFLDWQIDIDKFFDVIGIL